MKNSVIIGAIFYLLLFAACSAFWIKRVSAANKPNIIRVAEGVTMTHYKGNAKTNAALLFIPGGGYQGVTVSEGFKDVRWLTSHGVDVFILNYRLEAYPAALGDSEQALAHIHNMAYRPEAKIDRNRIGIAGTSAGGHLALLTMLHGIGRFDILKPALGVFISPIVTMQIDQITPLQCLLNMAGSNASSGLELTRIRKEASVENYFFGTNMAPAFIAQNSYDDVIPWVHTVILSDGYHSKGIDHELHLYNGRYHGMADPPPWIDDLLRFMKGQRFIQ